MPQDIITHFAVRASDSQAEEVITYVQAVLSRSTLECEEIPDALRDIPGMEELNSLLFGIRHMTNALSRGELEYRCAEKGYVIGSLKSLQADLRHLTWQTRCIARGDYQHRVNFLGDFSTAFNTMAEELDKSVAKLTTQSTEYKEMSNRDALTGLLNRRAFTNLALDALQQSMTHGAMPVVTKCCAIRPGFCNHACARMTSAVGMAARNSFCCCRIPAYSREFTWRSSCGRASVRQALFTKGMK
jgi:hypothetical protein